MIEGTPAELEAAIRRRLRRGTSTAIVAAAAGAVVGAVFGIVLHWPVAAVLLAALTSAGLLAIAILPVASAGAARRIRPLLGGYTTDARRIERVLGGADERLTADQLDRARRCAAVLPELMRQTDLLRLARSASVVAVGLLIVVLSGQPILLVLGLVLLSLSVFVSVVRRKEARRLRGRGVELAARSPFLLDRQ